MPVRTRAAMRTDNPPNIISEVYEIKEEIKCVPNQYLILFGLLWIQKD